MIPYAPRPVVTVNGIRTVGAPCDLGKTQVPIRTDLRSSDESLSLFFTPPHLCSDRLFRPLRTHIFQRPVYPVIQSTYSYV